ncbi:hypothetical protein RGUI_2368 [Rhodovulum sp. P5]|uniref:hypothetical protein n=1 Tax=Rhodovulum sp. P5 TaxID=1564506 RepID=UPI0009C2842F|nr:hypothetical protein [Rhodovulum sp. P5]ARE40509.1 hypothetical protein RGUI_2368 [Rhodovulum sp. P5]
MQEKPLSRQELELLTLVNQLHEEKGPFERDFLSVRAKGLGLEFPRAFRALKDRGLIEERERRPVLVMRLFGSKPKLLLRPSDKAAGALRAAPAAEPAKVPAAPAKAEVNPEPAKAEPPAPAHPEPPKPASEPGPAAPKPAPKVMPGPATAARPPVALTADDDDVAVDEDTVPLASALDPETVDEVRELVAGMGMELTFAGEALMGQLVAKGAQLGDALSQMLLISFAHAVQEDETSGGKLMSLGLRDYVVEVMQEVEKLRDAGFVGDARFEEDMRRLWSMFDGDDRMQIASTLLSDPIAGVTPPALLPEDLRPFEET